ncbi:MAG: AAA family ATPase [Bacteroidetes bacterium]|nr:AAA family ATPase [Bacteroidota bacterium]
MVKNIYVAATRQHVGKTTSTLGLVSTLKDTGADIGYCKPVGQQYVDLGDLRVDKDAHLFSKFMKFQLNPDIHSPVILGKGATSAYLENPEKFNYEERLIYASKRLRETHDIVVYEGTGHPGVGSVVELSNADVAKLVDAKVIMVVKGGIGSTIDELCLCLAKFKLMNIPVVGVIINKVLPAKIEKVRYYVGKKLRQLNIELLGVLPYDKSLSNPIMSTVGRAIKGHVVANEGCLDNIVENIVSGSLIADVNEIAGKDHQLMVVSQNSFNMAVSKIKKYTESHGIEGSPLSGIIVTGDGKHTTEIVKNPEWEDYINKHKIPVITTNYDTLGSMIKINRIEVKINTRTPWKVKRAIELIKQHVNLENILNG